jgi:hypothetical protein
VGIRDSAGEKSSLTAVAKTGGPERVRTADLLNAIEALFQLSYEPVPDKKGWKIKVSPTNARTFCEKAVFLLRPLAAASVLSHLEQHFFDHRSSSIRAGADGTHIAEGG